MVAPAVQGRTAATARQWRQQRRKDLTFRLAQTATGQGRPQPNPQGRINSGVDHLAHSAWDPRHTMTPFQGWQLINTWCNRTRMTDSILP